MNYCLYIFLLWASISPLARGAEALYIGVPEDMKMGLSDQNSRLALNVLLKNKLKEQGFDLRLSSTSSSSFAKTFPPLTENGEAISFFHIPTMVYHGLTNDQLDQIIPVTLPARGTHGPYTEYVVLGRPGVTLESLQNETIHIAYGWDIGRVWMDQQTRLATGDSSMTSQQFFENIKIKVNAADTILPVFFGKIRACVTTKIEHDLLCELNPQVKNLNVIMRSPKLVPFIGCIKREDEAEKGHLVEKIALKLHLTTRGKQALNLLKLEKFVRYEKEHLEATMKLLNETTQYLEASTHE